MRGKIMYQLRRLPDGVIGGFKFEWFEDAKREADRLCNEQDRQVHYEVVKIVSAYVTSTLDEAIKT
jgi:hypothetical protein